jgi:predicted dehydrogenase
MTLAADSSASLKPTTESATDLLTVGVIGYGYWGPNIVRNFHGADNARVEMICDANPCAIGKIAKAYPDMHTTTDFNDILQSPAIDIVAVVTPVSTHYDLARRALENGKHVFVEKPFTATAAEAEKLVNLAERKNLKIMVDHTFLFTGAVRKMKELVDSKSLGNIYYYDSTRVNLGLFQHDVNVVWDLAPHDFSIMLHLIQERPTAIAACGKAHVSEFEDVAYVTVYFDSTMIAHFNVNWLSPVKVRTTLIGGEKKMLVWNDVNPDEKIKIYDKGIDVKNREGIYKLLVSYRSGDMLAPKVEQTEALRLEAQHFIDCIVSDQTPINDGVAGMEVVKMLEACNKSLQSNGQLVTI